MYLIISFWSITGKIMNNKSKKKLQFLKVVTNWFHLVPIGTNYDELVTPAYRYVIIWLSRYIIPLQHPYYYYF